jgi:hypothetical protein
LQPGDDGTAEKLGDNRLVMTPRHQSALWAGGQVRMHMKVDAGFPLLFLLFLLCLPLHLSNLKKSM